MRSRLEEVQTQFELAQGHDDVPRLLHGVSSNCGAIPEQIRGGSI